MDGASYFDPLQLTRKFNPNHDEQGKFSSGGDGSTKPSDSPNDLAPHDHPDRVAEVVKTLAARGYVEGRKGGMGTRIFTKTEGNEQNFERGGFTNHTVSVSPNGTWTHFAEATHKGANAADLGNFRDADAPSETTRPAVTAYKPTDSSGRPDNFMMGNTSADPKPEGFEVFLPGDTQPSHQNVPEHVKQSVPTAAGISDFYEAGKEANTPVKPHAYMPVLSDFMGGGVDKKPAYVPPMFRPKTRWPSDPNFPNVAKLPKAAGE